MHWLIQTLHLKAYTFFNFRTCVEHYVNHQLQIVNSIFERYAPNDIHIYKLDNKTALFSE